MVVIFLNGKEWKHSTMKHFGLNEKQWLAYYRVVKDANGVIGGKTIDPTHLNLDLDFKE